MSRQKETLIRTPEYSWSANFTYPENVHKFCKKAYASRFEWSPRDYKVPSEYTSWTSEIYVLLFLECDEINSIWTISDLEIYPMILAGSS